MTAAERAQVDEALDALADVTVALLSLSPLLRVIRTPGEAVAFADDAAEAALRARRHLNALRDLLDEGGHSVRVVP